MGRFVVSHDDCSRAVVPLSPSVNIQCYISPAVCSLATPDQLFRRVEFQVRFAHLGDDDLEDGTSALNRMSSSGGATSSCRCWKQRSLR